jgi:hypothetical protein
MPHAFILKNFLPVTHTLPPNYFAKRGLVHFNPKPTLQFVERFAKSLYKLSGNFLHFLNHATIRNLLPNQTQIVGNGRSTVRWPFPLAYGKFSPHLAFQPNK